MRRKVFFILSLVLLTAGPVWADKLIFKNGKTVEGKIYEDTGYSVKIMVGKIPYTYYKNEIESIVKDTDAPVSTEAPVMTPQKKELILRLLEANGARDNISKIFQQIVQETPAESQADMRELLKTDEVIEQIIPVYASYYTEAELKELIIFYKSPAGSKHISVTPLVMEDTMKEVAAYFQQKIQEKARQESLPSVPNP